MVNLAIAANILPEQRVIFHHISWIGYEQILISLSESRSARLYYDQGKLEIIMPLEEHESATRLIELFIRILVVEIGLKIRTMGSTTLKRPDLEKGAEPDNCYYIQNQPLVVGKKINLNQDPPPDLVVEVELTHSDLNKLNLYAQIGVPEFWRYNGEILRIYQLQDDQYIEVENSPTFRLSIKERLNQFLAECQIDEVIAEKSCRAWIKKLVESRSI